MDSIEIRDYQCYRDVLHILKDYISNDNLTLLHELNSPSETLARGTGGIGEGYAVYLSGIWHTLLSNNVIIIDKKFNNFINDMTLWKTIQYLPIESFNLHKHSDLFGGNMYRYKNIDMMFNNGKQLTILTKVVPLRRTLDKYDLVIINEEFLIDEAVKDIFCQLDCKKKIIINK